MENMNRGRNLINEKKEEKEERDVPLYCNITVFGIEFVTTAIFNIT